jgi:hypothetical protein
MKIDLANHRSSFSLLRSGQNAGGGSSYGAGGASYEASAFSNGGEAGFGGGSSSYEASASFSNGGDAGFGGGSSSFESASFSSGGGAGYAAGGDASSFQSSSNTQVQRYATDAQGLFQDPNPQIIRRPAAAGVQTYTQNIRVRFLQPPPVPPPGVCRSIDV